MPILSTHPHRAPTDVELREYCRRNLHGRDINLLVAHGRAYLARCASSAAGVYHELYGRPEPPAVELSFGYVPPVPEPTPPDDAVESHVARRPGHVHIAGNAAWVCYHCDMRFETAPVPAPLRTHDDKAICHACVENNYTQLHDGTYAPNDDACCCVVCEKNVLESDAREVDGEMVCYRCVERSSSIVYCSDDETHHFRRNAFYDEAVSEWVSDSENLTLDDSENDSDEDDDSGSGPVFEYNANVLNILGTNCYLSGENVPRSFGRTGTVDTQRALIFGVELETDCREGHSRADIAAKILETSFSKYGICKSDGTVTGPECVTLPADLESHRKVYKWAEWCKALAPIARGFYGIEDHPEGCGMHVHINRAAVSPYTAGKMMVFMNREENREFLNIVAQRRIEQNSYCKFKRDKMLTSGRHTNYDRYEALNITPHTIEVRIFRANLSASRILKNLEFCHALVHWAAQESAQELTATRLHAWVTAHRSEYPELVKFLSSRMEDNA